MTTSIEQRFNSLEWHDAILLGLTVDRSAPGENDMVLLDVEWPDGVRQRIRFSDCYALDVQMNFSVIATESIRDAECFTSSPQIENVRRVWAGLDVSLGDLLCFAMRTNSTGSVINIIARAFQLVSLDED